MMKRTYLILGAVVVGRLFVGGLLLWAGVDTFTPPYDVSDKSPEELAAVGERFMNFFHTLESTGGYWRFISITQIVAGVLLVTQRWALLGALIALPFLCNVFAAHLALSPSPIGAMQDALLLVITIALLVRDWPRLRQIFFKPTAPAS